MSSEHGNDGDGQDNDSVEGEGAHGDAGAAPLAAKPATKRRRAPSSARRRSRELALQGLYEWLLGGADAGVVDAHVREQEGFAEADEAHFDTLLHGCIAEAAALDALLLPHLDRPVAQLSPVEHATLLVGTYELRHCLDIPYKVAINEAVELAKSFGGTDGHKYVNGVLDKVAFALRPREVETRRR
ncbi:MAG: transcription antitermination factor NusB [Pseudomonadota bacterium]|nr:transcription antitermination factor NusB [Pseudomonadota bacterium]